MELPVVIRPIPNQRVSAKVIGVPELAVEADSETAALGELLAQYKQWLGDGRVVGLQVEHPLMKSAGWAKEDDEMQQMYLEELRKHREAEREAAFQEAENERLSA